MGWRRARGTGSKPRLHLPTEGLQGPARAHFPGRTDCGGNSAWPRDHLLVGEYLGAPVSVALLSPGGRGAQGSTSLSMGWGVRGDSSSLGDPQRRGPMSLLGPIWGSGVLVTEACASRAGEHRWGDESFLLSGCLRVSEGWPPASLLGDHGLLGDIALELRAEFTSVSTGASSSRGRPGVPRLGGEQLLAAKRVASEMELPCGPSSEVVTGG